ncbi:DUF1254 domain-containing protein [Streptomyces sp. NPDC048290]|uniref:DUF1254 domain-containing protein n=1 Tax=Streptomyces sp. NPDC048290 TaxID=3155811 RepID=UPI0034345D1E
MSPSPSDQDIQTTATDVYVFGYPLVLADITRQSQTNTVHVTDELAPVNQFCHHSKLPDPDMKIVVRPNLDTFYSQAWLDLTAEPLVLSVPVMDDDPDQPRYWLMQMMDFWTNTVQDPSSLVPLIASQDGSPYNYLITGPGWQGVVPADTIQLAVPTDTLWIVGRTEVRSGEQSEIDTVTGYQQQMKLIPLSHWSDPDGYVPPDGTYDPDLPTDAPADQIAAMDGRTFFDRLKALLATTPPSPADAAITADLAAIGLLPGSSQPLPDDTVLDQAVSDGKNTIANWPQPDPVNGWNLTTTDIGTYGTDYGQRAYIALTALGANLPNDALYPSTAAPTADPDGNPIRYTLKFDADDFPVNAFWSLTAYNEQGFLIPNNPDGNPDTDDSVYSIGHRNPVPSRDPDDHSLTLYIQYDNPGDSVPVGNWLPIGDTDTFTLMLRLYAPQTAKITPLGPWKPPPLTPTT